MSGKNRRGPVTQYGSIVFWHHLLAVMFFLLVGLYYGAGFLIPLAVSILVFVLLTAIIDWIGGLRLGNRTLPRWAAQILGFAVVAFGLGLIISVLVRQSDDVVAAAPHYQIRFSQILGNLSDFAGEDLSNWAKEQFTKIDLSGLVQAALGSAGSFLSGFALFLLYIPFMMIERKPMLKKIGLAAGSPQTADRIQGVIRSISTNLQLYVGTKTMVSMLTGVLSYAVMKPVGLDFAETWAVLAFTLNFIPTIGSILGVAIPVIVALVQFETLTPFLIVLCGCGAIQFAIGNVLEPALTGKTLNLSPLAVVLALTFWTTLWGIAGALLSVPITVCVLIIFANLPETRPWAILLSGDGNLAEGGNAATDVPETQHTRDTPGAHDARDTT